MPRVPAFKSIVAAPVVVNWALAAVPAPLSVPFSGLDIVADAKLTSELKFGYLAVVKWLTAVGTMGLSIIFAKMGLGAYSFVLPLPIVTVMRLVLLWSAARPPIR